ncbi:hypothetical protein B0H14DRAFT_1323011 [Mycena olivaceomarginata]|nr:hypothetical protein B0H14DRAFT_1323011 [Mycena olivaceomarginata]
MRSGVFYIHFLSSILAGGVAPIPTDPPPSTFFRKFPFCGNGITSSRPPALIQLDISHIGLMVHGMGPYCINSWQSFDRHADSSEWAPSLPLPALSHPRPRCRLQRIGDCLIRCILRGVCAGRGIRRRPRWDERQSGLHRPVSVSTQRITIVFT